MKNSEILQNKAAEEDNDIKAFGIMTKALRESRSEKFIDGWLKPLSMRYEVVENNHKYTITTQKFGVLDYFPKANKLLIRKDNKWIKPGLKWIINKLMK